MMLVSTIGSTGMDADRRQELPPVRWSYPLFDRALSDQTGCLKVPADL